MKVIQLNDISWITDSLVSQINASGFEPDVIVYVERAGRLIGVPIAQKMGKPCISVTARRKGSNLKTKAAFALRWLPRRTKEVLRHLEIRLGVHQNYSEREVEIQAPLSRYSRVLIVDDSIDTGSTIVSTIKRLEEDGIWRDNIRIAAITTASLKYMKPIILPDYSIYRDEILQYPWSSDSHEYDAFLKIYNQLS